MNEDSNDFSDEGLDDEFEESMEERKKATNSGRGTTLLKSGPFDEAFEVSQDPSVAESFDTRDKVRMSKLIISNNHLLVVTYHIYLYWFLV